MHVSEGALRNGETEFRKRAKGGWQCDCEAIVVRCRAHTSDPEDSVQMQYRRLAATTCACAMAVASLSNDTRAQAPSAAGQWPARLDAMAAAPGSHRVLLENERVRVLEVVVKPGEREPVHTHSWPSLMFITHPAKLRYIPAIVLGSEVQLGAEEIVTAGRKPTGTPLPRWLPPEGPHAVVNIDTTEYRALRVEIKPEAEPSR
jgi:hypothetical protein